MCCLPILNRQSSKVYALTIAKCDISYNCVSCAICLYDFDNPDMSNINLPCGHIYHANCILNWFDKNMHCPLCRVKYVYIKK